FAFFIVAIISVPKDSHSEPIRFATGFNFEPFSGPELPYGGLAARIVSMALPRTQIAFAPWKQIVRVAKSGEVDAIFPHMRSPIWERDFLYSSPILELEFVWVRRASDRRSIESLSKEQITYCLPLGWTLPPPVMKLKLSNPIHVQNAPDLNSCLKMISMSRVDLTVAPVYVARYAIDALGYKQEFRLERRWLDKLTLHALFPRNHPRSRGLLDKFDRSLRLLHASGEFDQVISSYLRELSGLTVDVRHQKYRLSR
ncbi:MAG: transporter substrate-binding domain-containing protein, partial [Rhodospirillaceae bacterium]